MNASTVPTSQYWQRILTLQHLFMMDCIIENNEGRHDYLMRCRPGCVSSEKAYHLLAGNAVRVAVMSTTQGTIPSISSPRVSLISVWEATQQTVRCGRGLQGDGLGSNDNEGCPAEHLEDVLPPARK